MAIKSQYPITITTLGGVNYDDSGRLDNESPNCSNVYGEAKGFSVWKGRERWGSSSKMQPSSHIHFARWKDQHNSHVIFGSRKLLAKEGDHIEDITGDLTFDADPRNPCSIISFNRSQYIVGGTYRQDQPFYWDGKIDHKAKALPVAADFRTFCEFTSRLWGFDADGIELYAFYGPKNTLDIKEKIGYLEFTDGPASRILGGKPYAGDYMLVWGDRGLWIVESTGSYPLFVRPKLINTTCDCVSFNSIIEVPMPGGGTGFAWMGRDTIWAYYGGQIYDLGISRDKRKARLIHGLLKNRVESDLYMVSGAYYPRRNCGIWSWTTKKLTADAPWSERAPKSLVLNIGNFTFWPLDHGYQSLAEVDYLQERRLVSADEDGYLWLIDYDIAKDKYIPNTRTYSAGTWTVAQDGSAGAPVKWHIDLGWFGSDMTLSKFLEAKLTRRLKGPDKVMVKFWDQYQAAAITGYFSIKENFDPAATFPSFDPGGPHDLGVPPEPLVTCQCAVDITSNWIKVRLHNLDGTTYYDGPEKPMDQLTIGGRTL